ncbi:MAG: flagellar motor switch protein FliM [Alicyclobacillaceae bacterium]|nr:flagellar motor switch protein FliM [Alicyclobacillaceae bacterium]
MPEVLSQSQIDALLAALSSGEIRAEDIRKQREPRVRVYDFRRAMRFSKDHLRIIHRVHEHFARLMTTHLSGVLRSVVQMQVESVDQAPYEEFIRSVPTLTVMYVFEFAPLEGKVVVEINPQIAFAMIDRMMGGAVMDPYHPRELTEIEVAVLRKALGVMPAYFAQAWRNVAELTPRIVSMESNPQFIQLATSNETILVVTFSAKVAGVSGLINVCIPYVTIEPIIPQLNTQSFLDVAKARNRSDRNTETLTAQLGDVVVEAAVVVGEAELTMAELLDVQVGDIIPLQAPIANPVKVLVQGVPIFEASIGTVRGRYAVKILGQCKGDSRYDRER